MSNAELRRSSFERFDKLVSEKGITYYRLGKETGIANVVFYEWKRGKSMPKTDKLKKIADYFGVTVDYFLETDLAPTDLLA